MQRNKKAWLNYLACMRMIRAELGIAQAFGWHVAGRHHQNNARKKLEQARFLRLNAL